MATTNYGWNTPTVGGDENTWGGELNTLAQDIDTRVFTLQGETGERKLAGGVIASATPTLDIALPANWRAFRLVCTEIEPVASAVSLLMRLSFDGGATYKAGASDYAYAGLGVIGAASSPFNSTAAAAVVLNSGGFSIAGGQNPGLEMFIQTPVSPGYYTVGRWVLDLADTTGVDGIFQGRGRCLTSSSRATNMRLLFGAGNIASARWALYGISGF